MVASVDRSLCRAIRERLRRNPAEGMEAPKRGRTKAAVVMPIFLVVHGVREVDGEAGRFEAFGWLKGWISPDT